MAAFSQSLPKLLLSRVQVKTGPAELYLDDSIHDFPVKNTFIDFRRLSPSFALHTRRVARSCSPRRTDCLRQISKSTGEEMETLAYRLCSPCGIRTPTADTMSLCSWVESLDNLEDTSPALSVASDDPRPQHHDGEVACHYAWGLPPQCLSTGQTTKTLDLFSLVRQPSSDMKMSIRPLASVPPPPPPPCGPAPGCPELPSAGSAGHHVGRCKPCAFVHTKGCSGGITCTFCHLCQPGERKMRQKAKKQQMEERRARKASRVALEQK